MYCIFNLVTGEHKYSTTRFMKYSFVEKVVMSLKKLILVVYLNESK